MKRLIATLVLSASVAACGVLSQLSPEHIGEAEYAAAGAAQEAACEAFIATFRAGKDEGLTCEASKARAQAKHPLCPLSFTCPTADAGSNG